MSKLDQKNVASYNLMQQFAITALMGEYCGQLVPILAGLKPLAIELPIGRNRDLNQFIASIPNLKTIDRSHVRLGDERAHIQPLYNTIAVQKTVNANKNLYDSLGLGSASPEKVILRLIDFYEGKIRIKKNSEIYWKYHEA